MTVEWAAHFITLKGLQISRQGCTLPLLMLHMREHQAVQCLRTLCPWNNTVGGKAGVCDNGLHE